MLFDLLNVLYVFVCGPFSWFHLLALRDPPADIFRFIRNVSPLLLGIYLEVKVEICAIIIIIYLFIYFIFFFFFLHIYPRRHFFLARSSKYFESHTEKDERSPYQRSQNADEDRCNIYIYIYFNLEQKGFGNDM